MIVPIICRTTGCPNDGKLINKVSGIEEKDLDLFYENFVDPEPEDYCSLCGNMGVAEEAEEEENLIVPAIF